MTASATTHSYEPRDFPTTVKWPALGAGDVVAKLDPQDLRLQVQSAEAELAAATSNLVQAAAELDRYSRLKASGSASYSDFDRKKAANDEAQGRLDRARRALDLAQNQLGYAELNAYADGTITATLAIAQRISCAWRGIEG